LLPAHSPLYETAFQAGTSESHQSGTTSEIANLQMQELKELQYKEDQLKKKEENNTQNFNRMIFLTLWALKTSHSD
jgi:hypothetical protein